MLSSRFFREFLGGLVGLGEGRRGGERGRGGRLGGEGRGKERGEERETVLKQNKPKKRYILTIIDTLKVVFLRERGKKGRKFINKREKKEEGKERREGKTGRERKEGKKETSLRRLPLPTKEGRE